MKEFEMPVYGRPKKVRIIKTEVRIKQFSPRGKPGRPDEVVLEVDELEALRLADLEGLSQAKGADSLGVSRPTFGRIVRAARRKIAEALVLGKIIRVMDGRVDNSAESIQQPAGQTPISD